MTDQGLKAQNTTFATQRAKNVSNVRVALTTLLILSALSKAWSVDLFWAGNAKSAGYH